MKRIIRVFPLTTIGAMIILISAAVRCFSQQVTPSPMEQAISNRLGREINSAVACESSVISLQHQLQEALAKLGEAQKKIEERTPKPEPQK